MPALGAQSILGSGAAPITAGADVALASPMLTQGAQQVAANTANIAAQAPTNFDKFFTENVQFNNNYFKTVTVILYFNFKIRLNQNCENKKNDNIKNF